jgi:hypothetical protein
MARLPCSHFGSIGHTSIPTIHQRDSWVSSSPGLSGSLRVVRDHGLNSIHQPLSRRQALLIRFGDRHFSGISSGLWLRVPLGNHFTIDSPYFARAAAIPSGGIPNTFISWWDNLHYTRKVRDTNGSPRHEPSSGGPGYGESPRRATAILHLSLRRRSWSLADAVSGRTPCRLPSRGQSRTSTSLPLPPCTLADARG